MEWFRKLSTFNAIIQSLFQGLEFCPTIYYTRFEMVTRYSMRSADTLTSPAVIDRFLNDEVATLGRISFHWNRPVDSGLRNLILNVQFFGPRLRSEGHILRARRNSPLVVPTLPPPVGLVNVVGQMAIS